MYQVGKRMYLLAVLVRDDGSLCRASIRTQNDAVLEETSDDSGTSAGGLG